MSFQNHYETRQTVKNLGIKEAIDAVRTFLGSGFRSSHLFTTANDLQLTIGKRSSRLTKGKPTFPDKPSVSHDREKKTLIDPNAFYLKALGITTDKGEIRAQQRDKWRQINKYVEVLRDHFERSTLKDKDRLTVVDMGSGKGYLTFAAYDYFANGRKLNVEMTGVDTREDLIALCNEIAPSAGFDGLHFVSGTIENFDPGQVDILIALHACDTATDDALFKGISSGAGIIVAAPCCHKEVRRQMKSPAVLKDILKHGSMAEREAETITDGLRAMLLEGRGYSTKVFEFVPTEHTPKNNMIVATKRITSAGDVSGSVRELMSFYSIAEQRLERLLSGSARG